MSKAENFQLSGSLVLSTGTVVPVRVLLDLPALSRTEQHELQNVRVPLHDLTPRRVAQSTSPLHKQAPKTKVKAGRSRSR
jgi:hypothetical protein